MPEAFVCASRRIHVVGFAIDFIPLILTFSHPGEGTHGRQDTASGTGTTVTQAIFEAGRGIEVAEGDAALFPGPGQRRVRGSEVEAEAEHPIRATSSKAKVQSVVGRGAPLIFHRRGHRG